MVRSITILVADDEELVLHFVELVLHRAGYRVLAATDAAQALRLCGDGAESIDLALLDLVMPVMNGRQLRDRLHAVYPNLPVLFMSGYGVGELREQCGADAPAGELLKKPFTSTQLLHRVREITERPRSQRA